MKDHPLERLTDRKLNRWRFFFQVFLFAAGLATYACFLAYDWRLSPQQPRRSPGLPFARATVRRIFYVNLDESSARRAAMEATLAAQPVAYERVAAVRGSTAADFAGELGDAVVAYHASTCAGVARGTCEAFPEFDDNVGLCCVASSKATRALGVYAVDRLRNASLGYRCTHWSAHAAVSSIWGGPRTCVRLAANWASHLKALKRALPPSTPARDDYVLILEDDSALAPDWLDRLRASELATAGPLAAAASGRRDWDYVRLDLDDADVGFMDLGEKRRPDRAMPLLFDECFAALPSSGYASWGAGALLVRSASVAAVIDALSDCGMALDAMLNFATHLGRLRLATLAAPIAGINATSNRASTITR